ncbi:MAG: hypothetical protein IAE91_13990, partial [Ignavibacteriaceae bacterium]|nr:hypothetical protein [Ignavibacteriaceae bacterium]
KKKNRPIRRKTTARTQPKPTTPPTPTDAIVKTWIGDGSDIAIGLKATAKTKKIVAVFNENGTYNVVVTDSNNVDVTYRGTYSTAANTGTTIRNITLNQSEPTSVTSSGIYQIDANGNLKYEVIQTTPAIAGFTAPNAGEGFGSTKFNSVPLGETWIQRFVPAAPTTDPIIASWLSEGTDVAPGLRATAKTKKITAVFNANGTYRVVATDSSNVEVVYEGTFTSVTNTNSSIRTITLNQSVPTSVKSGGIFRVTNRDMWYEVIQTEPAISGFAAPTAAGGFGSTSYNSVPLGATWIQKFVRQ